VGTLLLLAALAAGPSGPASATARAERLTQRAITEYDGGDFDHALADAKQAYAIKPAPGLLFNLGQIQRALHHWEDAAFSYRAYLRELPDAPNRSIVEGLLREVQKKLSDDKAANAPPLPPTPGPSSPEAPPPPARVETATAQVHRIAVLDVQAQSNVPETLAKSVLSLVVHDVRQRATGAVVVGADEIRAMLGLEHQKQLLGCTEVSCLAEIGGALGAEKLVLGSLSRFGDTYVLDLKLVEARSAKVLAEGSVRVQDEGALPDAVTRSVVSLFPNGGPVDTSPRPELTQAPEARHGSHALAWTLFVASGVAVGFALYGVVRDVQVQNAISQLTPEAGAATYQANIGTALGASNAANWQIAAIALGVGAVAAAVGGGFAW
jgi:tetratricopeptide (TPR) repeat protein